jgi:2-polyprenyl-3-methyl-5-hydroxy-6-metoxy-1,4-benzoquinol methylase
MTSRNVTSPVEIEYVACALCGGDDAGAVMRGSDVRRRVPGRFTIVRCGDCGLAYVSPRPTPRAIARYYPADYAPHQLLPPSFAERLYYRLFRRLPAPRGARVLDVGCGGGKYLRFLRDSGYVVAGVEVNADVVARLRADAGLEVHPGVITEARIPDQSFDVVTFWWVLEHTHDPLETLRAAHRVLKPGGMVVVGLQNFAALGRTVFGAHWHHLDLPGHLYHFEPVTLRKILTRAGFTPRRVRHDLIAKDVAPSLGYWLGLRRSLDWALPNALAVPLDLFAWGLRRSGLITAYAVRP